jgi:branched-chain amino acid transport system permease protein
MRQRVLGIAPWLAALALFAAAPLAGSAYLLDFGIRVATTMVVAVSWNLAAGAGLISLGHAAFWGVGAYAGVLVLGRTHSTTLGVLAGAVAALAVGLLLGVVSARMRRFYFAIATLAYAEAFRIAAITFPGVTGGSVGLFMPAAAVPPPVVIFYAVLGIAALWVVVSLVVARRRAGFAFSAMRDNEDAAMSLGVNPFRYRLLALALSAAPVGGAATLATTYSAFLDPDIAFDPAISIEAQIATIAGGIYSLPGPVVGAVVVTTLAEVARQAFGAQSASLLVFGVVLVVLILFLPGGVAGGLRRLAARS